MKSKLSTAKKSKTTTFSRVFPKKIDNFLGKSDFEQCVKGFIPEGIHSWRDFFWRNLFEGIHFGTKIGIFPQCAVFYYRWRDRIHCLLYTLRVNGLMISFEWFQVIFIHVSIFFSPSYRRRGGSHVGNHAWASSRSSRYFFSFNFKSHSAYRVSKQVLNDTLSRECHTIKGKAHF